MSFLFANITEWILHKYILHGLGIKKNSYFNYHWRHHNACRKNKNYDPVYLDWSFKSDVWKELFALVAVLFIVSPIHFVFPTFFYCLCFWAAVYFSIHAMTHLYINWGKRYFPHHYDHHMGKNQNLNWGVLSSLIDIVFGTRKKYK